jgi:hypothetical protein
MNGVRQSECIFITLGDSGMLSAGGIVSLDDSVVLLNLANALVMLGSWSSYIKIPGGSIAQLEPRLANTSVTVFPSQDVHVIETAEIIFQLAELIAIHHHLVVQT